MSYWAVARIKPNSERRALHFLGLAGYETYAPRLRERRTGRDGRRIEVTPLLFPGYCFVAIVLQWVNAEYAPGVIGIVKNGIEPGRISDHVIAEIRGRERNGLIELPPALRPGDPVRILHGPFRDNLALYAGQAPHDRVAVLLRLLGGQQRVELPAGHVEAVPGDERDGQWSREQLLGMDAKFSARMRHANGEPICALVAHLRAR